jgi:hypothetical protein
MWCAVCQWQLVMLQHTNLQWTDSQLLACILQCRRGALQAASHVRILVCKHAVPCIHRLAPHVTWSHTSLSFQHTSCNPCHNALAIAWLAGAAEQRRLLTRQGRLRADERTRRDGIPRAHMERVGTHSLSMRTPKAVAGEEVPAARQLLTRQGRLRADAHSDHASSGALSMLDNRDQQQATH